MNLAGVKRRHWKNNWGGQFTGRRGNGGGRTQSPRRRSFAWRIPHRRPGGATPGKPVGLFLSRLIHQGWHCHPKTSLHPAPRDENKQQAAQEALLWLRDYLNKLP